jgi:hypothetical protein
LGEQEKGRLLLTLQIESVIISSRQQHSKQLQLPPFLIATPNLTLHWQTPMRNPITTPMGCGKTRSLPSKDKAQTDKAQTRMTPHLAPNHESSGDLQDLQSITATASISTAAASSIAAIAAIATIPGATTTAPIVGEVGVADTVDDEFAKEDHGNGKVGNADPVKDESAKEDHGGGEVGDADPANDEFATENHGDAKVGNADPTDDEFAKENHGDVESSDAE